MPDILTEGFIEYGIGSTVVLIRIFSRCLVRGGPKKWQGDDWLSLLVIPCYTFAIFGMYVISKNGINISKKVNDAAGPEETKRIELGSKFDLIIWVAYTTCLAALKGSLLFFYWRLTEGLWQKRKLCVISSVVVVLAYIVSLIVIFTNCIPFDLKWQVKPHPGACPLGIKEYYGVGITNILTDSLMLAIPLPLLWRSKFPLMRKIFLLVLLSGGIFVIIAAFLRMFFSIFSAYEFLRIQPNSYQASGFIIGWCLREVFVSVVVIQLPCITPLFRQRAWKRLLGLKYPRTSDYASNRNPSDVEGCLDSNPSSRPSHQSPMRKYNTHASKGSKGSSRFGKRGRTAMGTWGTLGSLMTDTRRDSTEVETVKEEEAVVEKETKDVVDSTTELSPDSSPETNEVVRDEEAHFTPLSPPSRAVVNDRVASG